MNISPKDLFKAGLLTLSVRAKRDSIFISLISWFLKATRINVNFDNYAITIGNTCWLPDTLYEEYSSNSISVPTQALLLHEQVHSDQADKEGFFKFAWLYLFSARHRTQYEIEAYTISMAVRSVGFDNVAALIFYLDTYPTYVASILRSNYLVGLNSETAYINLTRTAELVKDYDYSFLPLRLARFYRLTNV
jgi:hypothetical protein